MYWGRVLWKGTFNLWNNREDHQLWNGPSDKSETDEGEVDSEEEDSDS